MMLVVLLLCGICSGMVFFGIDPSTGYPPTVSCSTLLWRQQWQGNVDMTRFNRNYTMVSIENPCDTPNIPPGNQNLLAYVSIAFYPCKPPQTQRNLQDLGYGGIMANDFDGEYLALYTYRESPYAFGIPFFAGESTNYWLPQTTSDTCTNSLGGLPNVSVYLTYPVPNYQYEDCISYSGGCFNIQWIGFTLLTFCMLVATAKFAMIALHEGKIQASIPQLTLTFAFLACFFGWLNTFYAIFGIVGYATKEVAFFFQIWPFTCAFTALIILGLYFKEVSMLTSAPSKAGFNLLFWPALVIIAFIWVSLIVQSFLTVFPSTAVTFTGSFFEFQLAVLCICSAVLIIISVWGSVGMLGSMGRGQKGFNLVLLILILYGSASVILIITCLMFDVIQNYAGGWGGPLGESISFLQWQWVTMSLMYFGIAFSMLMVTLLFRVSVSKEIELSKSATSSTSRSGSSSGGSSSSSSSGQDPVIEL